MTELYFVYIFYVSLCIFVSRNYQSNLPSLVNNKICSVCLVRKHFDILPVVRSHDRTFKISCGKRIQGYSLRVDLLFGAFSVNNLA